MTNSYSVDVNQQNFKQLVLDGSQNAPVIVDFWAPWCGPCRTLKPVLEKLSEEYQGKFILAKVNADENPALSSQYGVRGIPSVKAFVGGNIVDEFSGALPEPSVREFINRLLPSPAETLRQQALQIYSSKGAEAALEVLKQAAELDPVNIKVKIDQAQFLLELNRLEEASALLNSLPTQAEGDPRTAALLARLKFAQRSLATGSEQELYDRISANPEDLQARLDLANLLVVQQRYEPAMEQLLEIVSRDRKFGDDVGRKTLLELFHMLGGKGELVTKYRRFMANILN